MHPAEAAYQSRIDQGAAEIRDLLDLKMPSTAEWIREDPSVGSILRVVLRDIIECPNRDDQTVRVLSWVQYLRELDQR